MASDFIILAAGSPPEGEAGAMLAREIAFGAVLVSCDRFDSRAHYVVGDGDGISAQERKALGERFILDAEQDTNDLCKAFRFIASRFGEKTTSPLRIAIFGATGKREDHAIANVFHLPEFETDSSHVEMVANSGVFTVIRNRGVFAAKKGDAFSFFATMPGVMAKSSGLEWPLDGIELWPPWRGTLNRATGDEVTVETSSPLIVYRPFPQNALRFDIMSQKEFT